MKPYKLFNIKILLLLFFAFFTKLTYGQPTFLFRLTSPAGKQIYLLGTIHYLSINDLPSKLLEQVKICRSLIGETVISKDTLKKTTERILELLVNKGFYDKNLWPKFYYKKCDYSHIVQIMVRTDGTLLHRFPANKLFYLAFPEGIPLFNLPKNFQQFSEERLWLLLLYRDLTIINLPWHRVHPVAFLKLLELIQGYTIRKKNFRLTLDGCLVELFSSLSKPVISLDEKEGLLVKQLTSTFKNWLTRVRLPPREPPPNFDHIFEELLKNYIKYFSSTDEIASFDEDIAWIARVMLRYECIDEFYQIASPKLSFTPTQCIMFFQETKLKANYYEVHACLQKLKDLRNNYIEGNLSYYLNKSSESDKKFLVDKNHLWQKKLKKHLKELETPLIAIGLAHLLPAPGKLQHLPGGEGLLRYFFNKHYTIERFFLTTYGGQWQPFSMHTLSF